MLEASREALREGESRLRRREERGDRNLNCRVLCVGLTPNAPEAARGFWNSGRAGAAVCAPGGALSPSCADPKPRPLGSGLTLPFSGEVLATVWR